MKGQMDFKLISDRIIASVNGLSSNFKTHLPTKK